MTDLARKLGVRVVYDSCRRFVGPLIGLALASGGAQAGAWEEFQQRCLMPIEEVRAPLIAGLQEKATEYSDPPQWRSYSDAEGKFLLVTGHVSDAGSTSCSLVRIDSRFFRDGSDALRRWASSALGTGRYVDLTGQNSQHALVYQSNEWREPRINVVIFPLGESDGPFLLVKETDLES